MCLKYRTAMNSSSSSCECSTLFVIIFTTSFHFLNKHNIRLGASFIFPIILTNRQ